MPDHKPIVFHNLSGYTAHLFIKEPGKKFNKDNIGVIENKDKYISFNAKVNVKLAGVTNKDGKEVCKNEVDRQLQIYGIKVVGKREYGCRPQVSRQMPRLDLK